MKRHRLLSILSIAMLSSACFAQTVSNVRFEQVDNKVKITYSLDKQADISVCVSDDGGKTWSSPLKSVSGDVGERILAGDNILYWDVLSEYSLFAGTNICFRVAPQSDKNLTFTINGYTFTMIYVKGGTFTMGVTPEQGNDANNYEEPAHSIMLNNYWIGQYEVTQGLWKAVMGNNPAYFQEGDSLPVEQVNYEDCQDFVHRLNNSLSKQLQSDKHFSLPTEAQWEYAARGGIRSQGYEYAGSNNLSEVAWWYADNSDIITTHPVGQKLSNELGLYDMSGNVWEWCQDRYSDDFSSEQENSLSDDSSTSPRANRGGSYYSGATNCRVSYRNYYSPIFLFRNLGLRLVLY